MSRPTTERLVYERGPRGERDLERAAELLRAGRLVAFPTETVYGLGALALDPAAVRRIFEAKGRPARNPLIVHVSSVDQARRVAATWPEAAQRLAERFWPGPLTLVLPRAAIVPPEVTGGLDAVGVRLPAHPVARALIERVGAPLAAPSANLYTGVSPTSAAHVEKGLLGRIDAILDGGETTVGIESTVLDLSGARPTVLRPGAVSAAEIEEVIGPVERIGPEVEAALPSPGLARRHYAPRARVVLLAPPELAARAETAGERVGVMALQPPPPGRAAALWVGMPDDPRAYARQLYRTLHSMEDAGVEELWIELPPEGEEWEGVRDRLRRAAG
jgi:L-threonylcarbamoyladenylate synthase